MDSSPEKMENEEEEFVPSSTDEIDEVEVAPKKRTKRSQALSSKKYREFEMKKNVAVEVAKYKNLYDTRDKKHADKVFEATCWNKIAKATGLEVKACIQHWESLKRSAKYYRQEVKIPFKSGASANDPAVKSKYKDVWSFAEVMNFYTPASLRNPAPLMSVYNRPSTSASAEIIELECDDSSMHSLPSESESAKEPVKKIKSSKQDVGLTDAIISITEYITKKPSAETTTKIAQEAQSQSTRQPLKHYEMWAHFEKMIEKLDDDDIVDLNLEITKVVHDAVKEARSKK